MAIEYYFDIIRGKKGHFWTRIRARNQRIIYVSEALSTKQSALKPVWKMVYRIGVKMCRVTFIDERKNTSEVL